MYAPLIGPEPNKCPSGWHNTPCAPVVCSKVRQMSKNQPDACPFFQSVCLWISVRCKKWHFLELFFTAKFPSKYIANLSVNLQKTGKKKKEIANECTFPSTTVNANGGNLAH